MATNKTVPTGLSVKEFLAAIEDPGRKEDAQSLTIFLTKTTGIKPKMWGSAIIGFGSYHYHYASGREGDEPLVSFSPRKAGISIYGISQSLQELGLTLSDLGKATTEGGCIRIKRLEDINLTVLGKIIKKAVAAKTPS